MRLWGREAQSAATLVADDAKLLYCLQTSGSKSEKLYAWDQRTQKPNTVFESYIGGLAESEPSANVASDDVKKPYGL